MAHQNQKNLYHTPSVEVQVLTGIDSSSCHCYRHANNYRYELKTQEGYHPQ